MHESILTLFERTSKTRDLELSIIGIRWCFHVMGISIVIAVNVFIVATVVVFAVGLASIVAAVYTLVVKVKSSVEPQPPSRLRDR